MIGPPKATPAQIERLLEDPPRFLERCYLAGYRRGRFPLEVLAGEVAAALGLSAHDDGAVDEVVEILRGLGYGDAPLAHEFGPGGGDKAWV